MATRKKVFLIVRADGSTRAISRYPSRLRMDEVAFPIEITFPQGWGSVQPTINVELPAQPTAVLDQGAPVWPSVEAIDAGAD